MKKKDIINVFISILLIVISSSVVGITDGNKISNINNDDCSEMINQAINGRIISIDDWFEQDKLLASDGAADDYFGWTVSISGDSVIIGANFDDDNGDSSGSAYIFTRSGSVWTEQAKLLASDAGAYDHFGSSVSIYGDYAIIGARGDSDNGDRSGSAYIFKRDGSYWTQQAKLLASDGAPIDRFGESVSINGDYAIIGAYMDDDNGENSGSAYIFTRYGTDWIQQAKLLASDGAAFNNFGESVSINGDYAIIGSRGDDDNGDNSGSAYIFKRDGTTWTQQAKLLASDGAADDQFGFTVSISGDFAFVGAPENDDNGDSSGSAYVFKRSGTIWTEQVKLLASDGASNDYFGWSVSIDGNYSIIGAYGDSDNGIMAGSAYIFNRSDDVWTEQAKLLASDGNSLDNFGGEVSIYDDTVIIGARLDDDNGDGSGSAYVFYRGLSVSDLDCSGNLHWTDITPGHTIYSSIVVENVGGPGSLLDWEIESYPNWGTWIFNPDSGIDLLAGESLTIDVEVVAPDEEEKTFTGEVVLVNSENDNDICVVDVSLSTPVNQLSYNSILSEFQKNADTINKGLTFKQFIRGRIDELYVDGNFVYFYAKAVRTIDFISSGESIVLSRSWYWRISVTYTGFSFNGIMRPHFIIGVFSGSI